MTVDLINWPELLVDGFDLDQCSLGSLGQRDKTFNKIRVIVLNRTIPDSLIGCLEDKSEVNNLPECQRRSCRMS